MVKKGGHAKSVNDGLAIMHAKEIRDFGVGVHAFALFHGHARPCVFQDVRPFFDGNSSVNTSAVQRRGFDDHAHEVSYFDPDIDSRWTARRRVLSSAALADSQSGCEIFPWLRSESNRNTSSFMS